MKAKIQNFFFKLLFPKKYKELNRFKRQVQNYKVIPIITEQSTSKLDALEILQDKNLNEMFEKGKSMIINSHESDTVSKIIGALTVGFVLYRKGRIKSKSEKNNVIHLN